jgi:hypothetical protein
MKKYSAMIMYTIDTKHPDRQYMENKSTSIVHTFSDVYSFPVEKRSSFWYNAEKDDMIHYIKNDLRLIAGGGYDCKHIHNVKFDIMEV